ncbi:MAG: M50 family metallopeptidase [Armatimonadota bacterium]|nr:M50 family metallopeptidase [Armatimonadota bacterium]
MSTILWAILAFGLMIIVHELGHFLVAKRAGITVYTFAIGFGPPLISFRRGETTYAINLIPFGGYVRMAGEDLDTAEEEGSFRKKPLWQRALVILAGPGMNLFLAALIFTVIAVSVGIPVGVSNRIGQLVPGFPAEQAGLRPGDAIVAINGKRVGNGEEVVETIHRSPGVPLVLTIRRGEKEFQVKVTPRFEERRGIGLIGFSPEPLRARLDPVRGLSWGLLSVGRYIVVLLSAIGSLFREGHVLEQLAGPVAAVSFLGEAAQAGFETFLYTAAFLSIMIGVFNLFPFPALDGGRLAFLAVEAIRRRPVDPKREGFIHLVGFMLILLLLVALTVRDIGRL